MGNKNKLTDNRFGHQDLPKDCPLKSDAVFSPRNQAGSITPVFCATIKGTCIVQEEVED